MCAIVNGAKAPRDLAAGIVNAINDVHAGVGYNKLRLHIRTAFICPEAADIRLQRLTGGYFPVPVRAGWAVMGRYIFVSESIKLLVNKKAAVFGGNSSVFKTALTCKLLKHLRKLFIKLFAAVGLMKLHCAVKQFTFIYLQ